MFTVFGQNIYAQNDSLNAEPVGLMVDSMAPMFEALDQDSNKFVLAEALENGSVVLIFYRGQWCPYCNDHLSNLQDSIDFITSKGATVVAVSPEKPDYLLLSKDKSGATFTLLYDSGYVIANEYDVLFTSTDRRLFVYNTFLNADLKHAHSDSSQRLPVPATFIISQEGIIVWRHFDVNYKNRSTVKEILENL